MIGILLGIADLSLLLPRPPIPSTPQHDAITGTEKLAVAQDYADRLTAGTATAGPVLEAATRTVATVRHPLLTPQSTVNEAGTTRKNAAKVARTLRTPRRGG